MVEDTGADLTLERDDGSGTRRPRALWGALAAIAVLAGTLAVVAASGGGDGSPRALPVGLGGSGFVGAEGAATADMSMAAWITYVADDGLPSLGGEAPAYELVTDLDQDRVRSLAAALGIEGEVGILGNVPDQLSEPWRIESDGAVLEVYGDGLGGWWYQAGGDGTMRFSTGSSGSGSSGWAPHPDATEECVPGPAVECSPVDAEGECIPGPATDCSFGPSGDEAVAPTTSAPECAPDSGCLDGPKPGCTEGSSALCESAEECTVREEPDGSTVEECVSYAPPVADDLPSREEAQAIALDLLSATGLDVDGARVTVEGPFDAWYVMVEPVLDGVPVAGWISTVGVGSEGAIVNASGTLATAERLDDYPLLDTRAAIDRLNAQSSGFAVAEPMPLEAPDAPVADSGAGSAQCADAEAGCETVTTGCDVQPDGREICMVPKPLDPPRCVDDPGEAAASPCLADPVCPQPTVTTAPSPDDAASGEVDASAPTCSPPLCEDVAVEPGVDPATTVPQPGCVDMDPITPEPEPLPAPEPVEVVLTGAERVLVLAPAIDGSNDAYLVPGYRFSSDDGHTVDVMAVVDSALAPTQAPVVTEPAMPPPDTTEIAPLEPAEPTCETSTEVDPTGSTLAVPSCPSTTIAGSEPRALEPGESPSMGVPYRVELILHCVNLVDWAGRWWATEAINAPDGWTGTGTFTLSEDDRGTYVDDGAPNDPAMFEARGADYPGCD